MNGLPVEFTTDPVWPWSLPRLGLPALAIVGLFLAALTLWTYRGTPNSNRKRIAAIVSLRLLALLLALLTVLRPSLAFRDDLNAPSTLIIVADASKSMTIRDEVDNKQRWATLQRLLAQCRPQLDHLRDEQHVQVVIVRFADEVAEYDPDGAADGPRTDFGRMLHTLGQQHGQDRFLRGLLVLSDGADNGTLYPAFGGAARWRSLGCPVSTFALGQQTTSADQRDIALTAIVAEPSPVPIKAKLTVRVNVDAPGFENKTVRMRLFVDDKEVAKDVQLPKSTGNEVELTTDAPATPGEVKVTVKADPLPGEASINNNEISTYLTATKEGLSVLYIDRGRFWETPAIRRALSTDPRIRFFEAIRQTDDVPQAGEADLFRFDKQAYDVIIIGDVSAARLKAANPSALAKIEELVRDKGVGLLMMGGTDSLGGDWRNTPIANALPVALDGAQIAEPIPFVPSAEGLISYSLRLDANPRDNEMAWRRLDERRLWLEGFTRLGRPKPGAVVLARRSSQVNSEPLLVSQTYGKGRTMALAVDTTWKWTGLGFPKSTEGIDLLARFWKQMVVYLAQQEDQEGSIWVRPDTRRLAAGGKLGFAVGLRGKTGIELPGGQFEVQVVAPGGGTPEVIPTTRERDEQRGTFWKTDKAGEYRLVVRGTGKDVDGTTVTGEANARFLIFQDDTELLRQAADHDFLAKLAAAGGGKFHRADELPKFLQEFEKNAPASGRLKARHWPDWRRATLGGFLPSLFVAFVAVLGLEWGLRRWWGMV